MTTVECQHTASDVFCRGPLLDWIQQSGIYPDSKTFVDMAMLMDPETVLHNFNELMEQGQQTKDQIERFLEEHFSEPGTELQVWIPEDWSDSPKLFEKITNPSLKAFAKSLNELWRVLGRKIMHLQHPERHSLLPVPHPFIIPGDRFREYYYWDSYWIIGGLLAVDMTQTAKGMLGNLLHLVDRYGFVPNGGRIYYLNRSQPPLLIPMIDMYYERTGDLDFIAQNITLMEKEHTFWIEHRTVMVKGSDGVSHALARYYVHTSEPRPEGYMADINVIQELPDGVRTSVLSHIASACESGWDFSSRWFGEAFSYETMKTCDIVPVDLNVYLCWNEQLLAKFHGILGNREKQEEFQDQAAAKKSAIDAIFWNGDLGAWFDFDLVTGKSRTHFYPSNVFPLLANCTNLNFSEEMAQTVLAYLKRCDIFDYPGGIPTSLINSGEQWDFPNAWSPLIHFMLESMVNLQIPEAKKLVKETTSKWIISNMTAWTRHGLMYEKYDARKSGVPGTGGEYRVQVGFGWTNGVILMLLEKYVSDIKL